MAGADPAAPSWIPASCGRAHRYGYAGAGVLLMLCVLWAVHERGSVLATVAACRADGGCTPARLAERTVTSVARLRTLGLAGVAFPALAGAVWGAPLLARAAEKGGLRHPGVGRARLRWFGRRLAMHSLAVAVSAAVLAVVTYRWWSATGGKVYGLSWYRPVILYATGPAAVAAALLGLAMGAGIGLLLRRTFAAMITTVLVMTAVRWAQSTWQHDALTSVARPGYWTVQWLDTSVLLTAALGVTALVAWKLYRAAPADAVSRPSSTCEPIGLRRELLLLTPGAFALGLGLWSLIRWDTMWRDEAATWQVAHRSVPQIWHMLGHVDLVHGLYYLLMHGVFTVFGDSLQTLRMPSVLATVAAAVITARVGNRLAGPAVGISAGAVLAVLPSIQLYAQEGRSYALVTAGVATATWLLIKGCDHPRRPLLWVGYAAAAWVTALLNWFSLLAVGAHALTLLWVRADRSIWRRWAAASGAAVLATLPLILASRAQSGQISWIHPLSASTLIAPTVLLLIGALCARIPHTRIGAMTPARLALPLLAVPQLTLLALSVAKPLYLERYILYCYIGLALLLGTALAAFIRAAARHRYAQSWLLVPMTLAVAITLLYPTEIRDRTSGGRVDDALASAVMTAEVAHRGDAVLFLPAARRDAALVDPSAFAGLRDIALADTPTASGTLNGREKTPREIRAAMLKWQRIILVTDAHTVERPPGTQRERAKQQVLDRYFHRTGQTQRNGRRVTVYERDGFPRIPTSPTAPTQTMSHET